MTAFIHTTTTVPLLLRRLRHYYYYYYYFYDYFSRPTRPTRHLGLTSGPAGPTSLARPTERELNAIDGRGSDSIGRTSRGVGAAEDDAPSARHALVTIDEADANTAVAAPDSHLDGRGGSFLRPHAPLVRDTRRRTSRSPSESLSRTLRCTRLSDEMRLRRVRTVCAQESSGHRTRASRRLF